MQQSGSALQMALNMTNAQMEIQLPMDVSTNPAQTLLYCVLIQLVYNNTTHKNFPVMQSGY